MNGFAGIDPKPFARLEHRTIQETATPFRTGSSAPHAIGKNLTRGLISHNNFQSHRYNTHPPEKFLAGAKGQELPFVTRVIIGVPDSPLLCAGSPFSRYVL